MNITTDPDQEIWHDMRKPGAYEWWYFDAEEQSSGYSVVLIWFAGFPFSPYYTSHYEQWKNNSSSDQPLPSNYSGFNFQLYEHGNEIVNFIREGGKELFESSHSTIGVRFEKNLFTYNALRDEYSLDIDFSFPARHKKVKAHLLFKSSSRISYKKKDTNNEGNVPLHQWLLRVPKAEVEGLIEVIDQPGGSMQSIPFQGKGYHDHNYGAVPMQEYIARWYWGRAFSGRYDLVYYVVFFKNDKYRPLTLLVLQDNRVDTITVYDTLRFDEKNFRHGVFSPLHSIDIQLHNKEAGVKIHHHKVLDAGPFYLRFSSDITVQVEGQRPEQIRGMSEFLAPSRLQSRIMRIFTCSRIWRDGVDSIMYDSYNRIKNSLDWNNQ
ncbi:MAG: carotenoid 1,2-hydratase [Chlorobium sp.]|nr:MAG: carotenoid 1,2-hydratase [Chlorobium sp.]